MVVSKGEKLEVPNGEVLHDRVGGGNRMCLNALTHTSLGGSRGGASSRLTSF